MLTSLTQMLIDLSPGCFKGISRSDIYFFPCGVEVFIKINILLQNLTLGADTVTLRKFEEDSRCFCTKLTICKAYFKRGKFATAGMMAAINWDWSATLIEMYFSEYTCLFATLEGFGDIHVLETSFFLRVLILMNANGKFSFSVKWFLNL